MYNWSKLYISVDFLQSEITNVLTYYIWSHNVFLFSFTIVLLSIKRYLFDTLLSIMLILWLWNNIVLQMPKGLYSWIKVLMMSCWGLRQASDNYVWKDLSSTTPFMPHVVDTPFIILTSMVQTFLSCDRSSLETISTDFLGPMHFFYTHGHV